MDGKEVWVVGADHWPRAYLRAELVERGYDAVGFVSIREAVVRLMLARSSRPALLVVDLHEQSVDSKLVAHLVRAAIPIVAVASHGETRDAYPDLGWAVLLHRPLTIGAIADTVDRMFGGAAAAPAPPG